MKYSCQEPKPCLSERQWRGSQSGQIVLEYVLLLIIGVAIAMLITTTMVSRSPQSPGFLIVKWVEIIRAIGEDLPDDVSPTN